MKRHQGNNHRAPKQIAQEQRAPETISLDRLMQSQLLRCAGFVCAGGVDQSLGLISL